ncbi:MAG TPA: hypothetical protein VIY28_04375 [Pseudonocardiaceae bacterium]
MTDSTLLASSPDAGAAARLLFCTRPAFGHVYPLMPLAIVARAATHDVVFATGEDFVPRLRDLGFEAHQVGIGIRQAAQELQSIRANPTTNGSRPDWDWQGQLFLGPLARRSGGDLLPLLDRLAPDLVIYDQVDFGAAVAAGVAEVPAICHGVSRAWSVEMRQAVRWDATRCAVGRLRDGDPAT